MTGLQFVNLGAEVIKVEPPEGAPSRHVGPYVDDHPDPITEITRLWKQWAPDADNYVKRVFEPDSPQANALSVGYLTAEEAKAVLAKEKAGR